MFNSFGYADTYVYEKSWLTTDINLKETLFFLLLYSQLKTIMQIKNSQDNGLRERVHQIIYNIIVTKYFYKTLFNFIDPQGETLSHI